MNQCEQCGQSNSEQSQFCRFCGAKFTYPQPARQNDYGYQAPRPYAWKTDEYQTQSEPRKRINQAHPLNPQQPIGNMPYGAQQMSYQAPFHFAQNYRCPNCGTGSLPVTERRISTAGWIVFAALLVFTVIFFWIGLLMKENVSICPVCRAKVA